MVVQVLCAASQAELGKWLAALAAFSPGVPAAVPLALDRGPSEELLRRSQVARDSPRCSSHDGERSSRAGGGREGGSRAGSTPHRGNPGSQLQADELEEEEEEGEQSLVISLGDGYTTLTAAT